MVEEWDHALEIGANYGYGVRRLVITTSPLVRKQKR
jgi:hypothetical protein